MNRVWERKQLYEMLNTNTADDRIKPLNHNRFAQVFANDDFFTAVYPIEHKAQACEVLSRFIFDYGIPDRLVFDNSGEQTEKKTEFWNQILKPD